MSTKTRDQQRAAEVLRVLDPILAGYTGQSFGTEFSFGPYEPSRELLERLQITRRAAEAALLAATPPTQYGADRRIDAEPDLARALRDGRCHDCATPTDADELGYNRGLCERCASDRILPPSALADLERIARRAN